MSSSKKVIFQARLTQQEASRVHWQVLQAGEKQKARYVRHCLLAGGEKRLQQMELEINSIYKAITALYNADNMTKAEKARLLRIAESFVCEASRFAEGALQ